MSKRISISAFVMAVDFCAPPSLALLPTAGSNGAMETPPSAARAKALLALVFAGCLVLFGLGVAGFCDLWGKLAYIISPYVLRTMHGRI